MRTGARSTKLAYFLVQKNYGTIIEIHEGTCDSCIAKRELLLNQMQNYTMKHNEIISQLHVRFKEIFNGLHTIREGIENHNLFRC